MNEHGFGIFFTFQMLLFLILSVINAASYTDYKGIQGKGAC